MKNTSRPIRRRNIRNGTRSKAVLTDTTGAVEIDEPRDRAAADRQQHQRRLSVGRRSGVFVIRQRAYRSGDSAHFANIYGASVSKETISRITNKVIQEMNDWAVRPPDAPYAAIFIDAMVVRGPRRPSRQVALPRRHRGQTQPGRGTRHPRFVGRHRP